MILQELEGVEHSVTANKSEVDTEGMYLQGILSI